MNLITWNPNDSVASLSENNLKAYNTSNYHRGAKATEGRSNGKWYWEIETLSAPSSNKAIGIGVCDSSEPVSTHFKSEKSVRYYQSNSPRINTGSTEIPFNKNIGLNDIVSVLLNMNEKKIEFRKNGEYVWNGNIDAYIDSIAYPMVDVYAMESMANFGATPFQYPVPEGYLPYDYKNATWLNPIKSFVKSNGEIFTYDEEHGLIKPPVSNPLTVEDFDKYGMLNLSPIMTSSNTVVLTMEEKQDTPEGMIFSKTIVPTKWERKIIKIVDK